MTSKSMEELNSEEYEDQIKNDLEVASVLSKCKLFCLHGNMIEVLWMRGGATNIK